MAGGVRGVPGVRDAAAAHLGGGAVRRVAARAAHGRRRRARQGPLPQPRLAAADGEHDRVPVRQRGGHLHAQPDGARAAQGLPRHQELHRRAPRDGGREREAGAAAAFGAATARRHGDEGGHHLPGGGPVPQDLHPEARERQHPVRGHRRLHGAGLAVHGAGAGAAAQRAVRPLRPARKR